MECLGYLRIDNITMVYNWLTLPCIGDGGIKCEEGSLPEVRGLP